MSPAERDSIMRRCVALAKRAWGETHPNPMVGAAIVEDDIVVAEGWHKRAGEPHAEIEALRALGRPPKPGAMLFVTLEPCSTHGRTGPCTEAIIASGIRYVVVGAVDPNPAHAGRGLEILKAAGVTVETRVLTAECEDLNLIFNRWVTHGTPLFAAKVATTLDGRTATRSGESKWITGQPARQDVMGWRRLFPAIAVGAGTVMRDRPRLTARLGGRAEWSPWRIVFDGRMRLAAERELPGLFTDEFRERTVVVTAEDAAVGYVRRLETAGVRTWRLPAVNGRVSPAAFRGKCAAEGVCGVYIEGGAQLLSEFLAAREIDYLFAYRAPVFLADQRAQGAMRGLRTERLDLAIRLEDVHHASFGADQLMRGRVVYPPRLTLDEAGMGG